MSFVKIMVHTVWGTKHRYPYLNKRVLQQVICHILQNAKAKSLYIDRINGHIDHMHCLLALDPEIGIARTMQLIKGESAFWINKRR